MVQLTSITHNISQNVTKIPKLQHYRNCIFKRKDCIQYISNINNTSRQNCLCLNNNAIQRYYYTSKNKQLKDNKYILNLKNNSKNITNINKNDNKLKDDTKITKNDEKEEGQLQIIDTNPKIQNSIDEIFDILHTTNPKFASILENKRTRFTGNAIIDNIDDPCARDHIIKNEFTDTYSRNKDMKKVQDILYSNISIQQKIATLIKMKLPSRFLLKVMHEYLPQVIPSKNHQYVLFTFFFFFF